MLTIILRQYRFLPQAIGRLGGGTLVKWSRAKDGNLFNHKQGSIAHSLSLLPSSQPDITEILLKMT